MDKDGYVLVICADTLSVTVLPITNRCAVQEKNLCISCASIARELGFLLVFMCAGWSCTEFSWLSTSNSFRRHKGWKFDTFLYCFYWIFHSIWDLGHYSSYCKFCLSLAGHLWLPWLIVWFHSFHYSLIWELNMELNLYHAYLQIYVSGTRSFYN